MLSTATAALRRITLPAQQLALQFDAPLPQPAPASPQLRVVTPPMATAPVVVLPAPAKTAVSVLQPSADRETSRRELERYLRLSLGMRVNLTITDNRRNLFSWRRRIDHVALRLHHMFLAAGPEAHAALASYMGGARERLHDIRRFIRDNMHQVRAVEPVTTEHVRGAHHDLRSLFDVLNHRYFGGQCDASIAWGKLPPRRRRRRTSMRLGSYTLGDAAIRIHPLLDDPRVPTFFVASVVHHEMLHHMVPAREVGGRLQYHCPEFRKRERDFEHFELAARWEKEHIDELLRR